MSNISITNIDLFLHISIVINENNINSPFRIKGQVHSEIFYTCWELYKYYFTEMKSEFLVLNVTFFFVCLQSLFSLVSKIGFQNIGALLKVSNFKVLFGSLIKFIFCCLLFSLSAIFNSFATPRTVALCPWISQARTLEWVVMPSSRGSSWPRDWTRSSCWGSCHISCTAGGFFFFFLPLSYGGIFFYLTVAGLICSLWDFSSSLGHAGSFSCSMWTQV